MLTMQMFDEARAAHPEYNLMSGFGDHNLGCALDLLYFHKTGLNPERAGIQHMANTFGITENDLWAFAFGFDVGKTGGKSPFFDLGAEVRKKYLPN